MTSGSLCTGYGGLDMAAEEVTGSETVWHCEYEDAPSALLQLRCPGVKNYGDLTALAWADDPVDVVTAGWPCQPFSGGGKRLGTADPRHLFPFIALGLERMRPPLFLGENVRGHLTLGFDVVLAELDRIRYDVRWVLIPASSIGAPHGRHRLWVAARSRETGGWPVPTGRPAARLDGAVWLEPDEGLFGAHPMAVNDKGSVPLWPSGTLVDGVVWEHPQPALESFAGLPPTPRTTDTNGAGAHGDRGLDLRTAVSLLPTPKTGPNRASRGALTGTSPGCDNGGAGQWSAPQLEQALELARGELPREYKSWDEVRGASARMLPTPTSRDHKGANQRGDDSCLHGALLPTPRATRGGSTTETAYALGAERSDAGRPQGEVLFPTPRATDGTKGGPNQRGSSGDLMLPSAVHLLPTPAAADGRGARNSTAGRQPDSQHHSCDTLGDLVYDGRLLPTPVAADGGGERGSSAGWGLRDESRAIADAWGPYTAAVRRWEALTRPAPAPTEHGRSGPRLSPRFVEWMQGLPDRWVTGVPGLTRNQQLTMLGNGVVPQCAAVAYTLLGVTPEACEVAA